MTFRSFSTRRLSRSAIPSSSPRLPDRSTSWPPLRARPGFRDLERDADEMPLGPFSVRVASIDDLICMKKAAGRKKDLIEVEVLGAVRREAEGGDHAGS